MKKILYISIVEGDEPDGDQWELQVKKGCESKFWDAISNYCEQQKNDI